MNYTRGKNPNSRRRPTVMMPERVEWLIRQVEINPCLTRMELAEMFTEKFGAGVKPCTVKRALNTRGIKLTHKSNQKSRAALQKYVKENQCLPIGGERVKDGVTYIKISDNKSDDYFAENYTEKHRYLWDLWNPDNKIKGFECVVFLDGNKANFSRENLYKVSKGVQTGMNKNGLWGNNPELTLAAIKYMELNVELRKRDSKWRQKALKKR